MNAPASAPVATPHRPDQAPGIMAAIDQGQRQDPFAHQLRRHPDADLHAFERLVFKQGKTGPEICKTWRPTILAVRAVHFALRQCRVSKY